MIFQLAGLPFLLRPLIQKGRTSKMNWNRNVCSAKLLIFNGGDVVRIQNLNKWRGAQLER
jgi:hypothetical protein